MIETYLKIIDMETGNWQAVRLSDLDSENAEEALGKMWNMLMDSLEVAKVLKKQS